MTDAEKLFEAYREGMSRAGVLVEESWDDLEPCDREAWEEVANEAARMFGRPKASAKRAGRKRR